MRCGGVEGFEGMVEDSKEVFGVGKVFSNLGGDNGGIWVTR